MKQKKDIKLVKELSTGPGAIVEQFNTQLKNLYNFDSLLGVLDSWQRENKEVNLVSNELDTFFKQISSQINPLKDLAKKLQFSFEQGPEIDFKSLNAFQELCKEAISSLTLLKNKPNSKKQWHWDPNQKSTFINLSDDNRIVTKPSTSNTNNSVVLGNIEMSQGIHRWEIEVESHLANKYWIGFGVIERHLVDYQHLDAVKSHFLASNGSTSLKKVKTLDSYDNKTYLCELDFEKETFKIFHQGSLICQTDQNIKKKTFVPYVALGYEQNVARLKFPE